MSLELVLIQVALPLAALALHAVVPAASWPGLALRTVALGLGITILALAGLWLFPPWWTPYLYLGLLIIAGFPASRRVRTRGNDRPNLGLRVGELVGFATIAAVAAIFIADLVEGRRTPARVVQLSTPLGPGRYLVVNGGMRSAINAHLMTLSGERFRPYRGQSYGVDIVAVNPWGLRVSGVRPADPHSYEIFGRPILSPCDGRVIAAIDGLPDLPVPEMDRANLAGNHVILTCNDVWIVVGHMRRGSVGVNPGDSVSAGFQLGEVGNSGNTGEPHLHIHAQLPGTPEGPLSGEPLPMTLDGTFPVRNTKLSGKVARPAT